ncbi:hypothetical protein TFLX_01610 [Thermoflexales bacterium]|nr:hypothetical protein TFLX_01610 [Thermoflexales bacterium]
MQSQWRVFFNVKTEDKAAKLLAQVREQSGLLSVDAPLKTYHRGGYVANFVIAHQSTDWNDCVVEVIEYGQRIAHDWLLTGDVRNALDGWSTRSSISGVSAIGWSVVRPTENVPDR